MKIDAWTGLGALEEGLGSHFVSQSCLGQKQRPGGQNVYASGLPFGVPFSTFSVIFRFFCYVLFLTLRFGGYQDQFFMEFGQLVCSSLEVVFQKFLDCRQIREMSL